MMLNTVFTQITHQQNDGIADLKTCRFKVKHLTQNDPENNLFQKTDGFLDLESCSASRHCNPVVLSMLTYH